MAVKLPEPDKQWWCIRFC